VTVVRGEGHGGGRGGGPMFPGLADKVLTVVRGGGHGGGRGRRTNVT
jgi:hypothetical protein